MHSHLVGRPRRAASIVVLAFVVAFSAAAQQQSINMRSVATTDGFLAPVVNPAAPAFGNAGGLGAIVGYDTSAVDEVGDGEAPDFSLFANTQLLSYAYRSGPGDDLHTGTLSVPLFFDLYAGVGITATDFSFEDPTTTAGLLFRPLNVLSLGATGAFPENGDPSYRLGGALRPLFVNRRIAQVLTVGADVPYRNDEFELPLLRVEAEPQAGLDIGAGWDFERERLQIEVSISYSRVRAGNSVGVTDNSGAGASAFVHFSTKDFRSFSPIGARTFAEYSPGPLIVEQEPSIFFRTFSEMDPTDTVTEVVRDIRRLARNDAVAGILFKNHNIQASYANFLEIKAALEEAKAAGKKIVFYFEQTNTLNYALAASVADEIYLNPDGTVFLSGFSRTRPYLKGFLDEVGVEVANIRSGEYKNVGNIFSETGMPASEREALEALLEEQYDVLLQLVEAGRGDRLASPAEQTVAEGPYLIPEDALDAGLVDALIYEDELEDRLEGLQDGARIAEVSARDQIRYEWSRRPAPRVAVIYATGNIVTGEGQPGVTIGSETMAKAIREARENGSIDGIILRVESGGGSGLASGIIAREVALTTGGEDPKPVVVSMAGSAASGGYYISAPADRIVAQPVTVTGSIGVVALLPNIEGLSEKYEVNWDTVKTTDTADLGALYRRLTPEERRIIQDSIDARYGDFVSVVAEHRPLERDEVEAVAGGRVWSGRAALENGLVDELGGLEEAVEAMKELLDTGADPQLVEIFPGRGFFDSLRVTEWAEARARAQLPGELRALLEAQEQLSLYGDEMILMLSDVEATRTSP
mgnify:CR=1 FL=1